MPSRPVGLLSERVTGFFGTGGLETLEVEAFRVIWVARWGGGGVDEVTGVRGGGSKVGSSFLSTVVAALDRLTPRGGGTCGFSFGDVPGILTDTQSGSSDGRKGLLSRLPFGTIPFEGGPTDE